MTGPEYLSELLTKLLHESIQRSAWEPEGDSIEHARPNSKRGEAMSQTIEERLATYVGSGEFPKEKSKILSDLMDWRLGGHGRGGRVGSVELAQLDAQRSEVKSACNAFVRSRWDDRELRHPHDQ